MRNLFDLWKGGLRGAHVLVSGGESSRVTDNRVKRGLDNELVITKNIYYQSVQNIQMSQVFGNIFTFFCIAFSLNKFTLGKVDFLPPFLSFAET